MLNIANRNLSKKLLTDKQIRKAAEMNMLYVITKAYRIFKNQTEESIINANKILESVFSAQITDPTSEKYGLWKPFLTDSSQIVYDENSAAHYGIILFLIYKEFSDSLDAENSVNLKNAISASCFYILHRHTHMQSTHVLIEECVLSALYGEIFHKSEFLNYSINMIKQLYYHTISQGSLIEYNSAYNEHNLLSLSLAQQYIKNDIFLRYTGLLNDIVWENLISHYHYRTNTITGPSQRMYPVQELTSFIYAKNKTREASTLIPCPEKYKSYFNGSKTNRYFREIVTQGSSYPYYVYSHVATTLIKPDFAIGTFNRGECWNEKWAFRGNFGTRTSPHIIKVTTIHDGYEFSSAQLSMIQHENYVLGHTTFATNRGDSHIEFDKTNGSIKAKDLRIRFTISGDTGNLKVKKEKNTVKINSEKVNIRFSYLHSAFEGFKLKSELHKSKNLCFDLIIYQGNEIKIDFTKLKKAIISWFFCISEKELPEIYVKTRYDKEFLISECTPEPGIQISLKSLYKPDTQENIHTNNRQYIQDTVIEKYVIQSKSMLRQYSYIIDYNPDSSIEIILNNNQNITSMINTIKQSEEEEINLKVKEIFSLIYKNNLSLNMIKRIAIRIISQIFEYYKEKNLRFETVIQEHSQTYQLRISVASDAESIAFHIFELLKILHSNYRKFSEPEVEIISKIINIIDEQYNNPDLSLEQIAGECNTSIFVVSRAFKKISNMKYLDYLTGIRINHAKNFLKNTDLSLEEIAHRVGYLNASSFIRMFKRKTGRTPNKYRNSPEI